MIKTFLAGACLALSLAACATPAPTQSVGNAALPGQRGLPCVRDTGTRLPVRASDCAAFGQSYTQQDLQRTGAHDTAQALQLLSPSLVISGH